MAIVHTPGRRPFGQNLVTVYIDGEQCINAQLRFPSLGEVAKADIYILLILDLLPINLFSPSSSSS